VALLVLACLATRAPTLRSLDVDNDEAYYTAGVGFEYSEYLRTGDLGAILRCRENYEHPPLVKLIYGAAIAATGQGRSPQGMVTVCRITAMLFACVTAALVFWVSPGAAVILCLHTWFIFYTSKGWLDSITVCFLTAAFVLLLKAEGRWGRWLAGSAVLLGAGVASKYVTGLFALVLFLVLLLQFGRRLGYPLAYAGIAVATFLALDPALWRDPVVQLGQSLRFHQVHAGSALYRHFLEAYAGDTGPLGEFAALWRPRALYQPDALMFGLDRAILVLGALGLPLLLRRSLALFAWFAAAALFLLLYPVKYPHYTMVLIPVLAIAAAEPLRAGVPALLARRAPRLRLPPWLDELNLCTAACVGVVAYAAIFAYRHRDARGDFTRADNSYAYTLVRLGRSQEAAAVFTRSAQAGGEVALGAHLNLAHLLLRERRPAEARAEAAEALRLSPGSQVARVLVGDSYLQEDRRDEALAEYLRVDPQGLVDPNARATLWLHMASVYVSRQQPDPAVPLLERVLEVNPRSGDAHYLLGLSGLLRRDLALAERELLAAVGAGVENAKIYQELGLVHAERGNYREAIRAWERSLRYDPQNAEVRQSIEAARGMLP
jgi:tetratricopeptide (TPR) repeat protein